jgi:hypothetical protein
LWQPEEVENWRVGAHIPGMSNVYVGMPMVEVVTPDGKKELWAVAAPHREAVTIVQQYVPPGSAIYPTHRRLPVSQKMQGLGPREAGGSSHNEPTIPLPNQALWADLRLLGHMSRKSAQRAKDVGSRSPPLLMGYGFTTSPQGRWFWPRIHP